MAPPKPYKPVAVTLPRPFNDPSFEAFRKELGEIASQKDRAALAGKVVAKGFLASGSIERATRRWPMACSRGLPASSIAEMLAGRDQIRSADLIG
jgi:hypothetical protein